MATVTRIGGAAVFRSLRQRVISRAALYFVLVFLLFFGVEVGLQWISGAYSSEFDDPDEPAHYVTGLMIRDYVAARAPAPPLAYAENYYLHYPKVSFGSGRLFSTWWKPAGCWCSPSLAPRSCY